MSEMSFPREVERWDVCEIACRGETRGNPFTDYAITGTFTSKSEKVTVDGFYDGDGVYRVRFMPSFVEDYRFVISGTFAGADPLTGGFRVTPASPGNHGPVRVANTFHFAYEDGAAYYPVGTTCYVWELQSDSLQKQTLETLSRGPFNKLRFCVLPKH